MALSGWRAWGRERTAPDPGLWGLERREGRLHMDGQDLTALADRWGTPLHVVSARVLETRYDELRAAFALPADSAGVPAAAVPQRPVP